MPPAYNVIAIRELTPILGLVAVCHETLLPLGSDLDGLHVRSVDKLQLVSLFCRVVDVRLDPIWIERVDHTPHEAPVRPPPQIHLLCRQMLAEGGVRVDQRPDIAARILGMRILDTLADTDIVRVKRSLGFFENLLDESHPAVLLDWQPHVAWKSSQNKATYSAR